MQKKILIVDDDPDILSVTGGMLEKRGFAVATAGNGVEALTAIGRERPDLILADVLMPEMDGFTLYKELKSDRLKADIPVLIITGRGKMEDSFKVMGVDGFISKPFSPEDLVAEIDHVFNMVASRSTIASSGKASARKKILVIGAEKPVVDNMLSQVQRSGHDAMSASSGADAIAKAVKTPPQMVFVDVQLTDMSLAELVDILRRLPQFGDNPVIGYSYYPTEHLGDPEMRRKVLRINEASKTFLKSGGDAYMGRYNHQLFIKTILESLNAGQHRGF